MPLIRYKVSMAGADYAVRDGDEREVDAGEAARLIAAGFAEPVAQAQPETATAPRSKRK